MQHQSTTITIPLLRRLFSIRFFSQCCLLGKEGYSGWGNTSLDTLPRKNKNMSCSSIDHCVITLVLWNPFQWEGSQTSLSPPDEPTYAAYRSSKNWAIDSNTQSWTFRIKIGLQCAFPCTHPIETRASLSLANLNCWKGTTTIPIILPKQHWGTIPYLISDVWSKLIPCLSQSM